jgi:hypothetical protein
MLAASVQHAHPRWDSLRGQRHICAGTRPHLRRDSPTSAPGLLYACRRRLARQSCGPVRQSRPAPMKMRRAQCCARGWRCACATRISCLCVRVSCVRVFVSVAPERSSSCCRCVAVNRRAMECALSTCEPNAHDKAAQVSRHYKRWRNSCRLCVQPTADADADAIIAGLCEPPTVRLSCRCHSAPFDDKCSRRYIVSRKLGGPRVRRCRAVPQTSRADARCARAPRLSINGACSPPVCGTALRERERKRDEAKWERAKAGRG